MYNENIADVESNIHLWFYTCIFISWCAVSSQSILKRTVPRLTKHDIHYSEVIMGTMASQITSLTIVYLAVDSRADQNFTLLAFVRGIHRWPLNSRHKWPVTWTMFPFDDVIMENWFPDRAVITVASSWTGKTVQYILQYYVKWRSLSICFLFRFSWIK